MQNLEFLKKNNVLCGTVLFETSVPKETYMNLKEREVKNNLWHKQSINMELALES